MGERRGERARAKAEPTHEADGHPARAQVPLDEVVAASQGCIDAAARLGCTLPSPFQTMSFLALSVIPSLKITDRGLVDVDRFELVPLRA